MYYLGTDVYENMSLIIVYASITIISLTYYVWVNSVE